MFAPDHAGAAAELVRGLPAGGRVLMTTWIDDGFVGEMFSLTGEFMPPPPPGLQPPPLWGAESHVREMFAAACASPSIAREVVSFDFATVEDVVQRVRRQLRTVCDGPSDARAGGPLGRVPRASSASTRGA